MPRAANQKEKVLYVMKILLQETDEAHPLSTEEIIEKLSEAGVKAERKSIYSDMETLRAFGLDVHGTKGRSAGYYVGERDFELPEIKLLIDSVQSSKFITERKTMQLIRKLAGLMSVHEAALMKRQLYVKNRIKSMNESIYYNVDAIHQAIAEDKPLALSWADENYYLIAYEAEAGKIKHFRVDKMDGIRVTEKFRQGKDLLPEKDMGEYARKNFSMFGGEEQTVTMRFSNRMIGVVIDTFGKDVPISSVDEDHFQIRATVAVSPQFFGWLFGLDGEVAITAPREVMEAFQAQMERVKSPFGA